MTLQYWLLGRRRENRRELKACIKGHCKHQTLIEFTQKEVKQPIGRGQLRHFERLALDYIGFFKIKNLVSANIKKMKNEKNVGTKLQKNKKKRAFAKHETFGY